MNAEMFLKYQYSIAPNTYKAWFEIRGSDSYSLTWNKRGKVKNKKHSSKYQNHVISLQ